MNSQLLEKMTPWDTHLSGNIFSFSPICTDDGSIFGSDSRAFAARSRSVFMILIVPPWIISRRIDRIGLPSNWRLIKFARTAKEFGKLKRQMGFFFHPMNRRTSTHIHSLQFVPIDGIIRQIQTDKRLQVSNFVRQFFDFIIAQIENFQIWQAFTEIRRNILPWNTNKSECFVWFEEKEQSFLTTMALFAKWSSFNASQPVKFGRLLMSLCCEYINSMRRNSPMNSGKHSNSFRDKSSRWSTSKRIQ